MFCMQACRTVAGQVARFEGIGGMGGWMDGWLDEANTLTPLCNYNK